MPRKPKQEPGKRPRGGKKGHRGTGRKLKPVACVNQVVVSKPVSCKGCGCLLLGEDPHPNRRQLTEIPKIEPHVTEFQQHTLNCLACGTANQADWPSEMPAGHFGERVRALTGYMSGRFGMTKRDIKEMLEDVYRVEIGLGSIPAQERGVSLALQKPVEAAHKYVQEQPSANVDETSWQEITEKCWLWVGVTASVTVFKIFWTRGAGGVDELLGTDYRGIVGSDRYSAYNHLETDQRQVCWAHLIRDFQAFVDRGGQSQIVGRLLLAQVRRMFSLWYRVRDGTLSRTDFQAAMQPIRHEVHCLLHIGTCLKALSTRKTCLNILKIEQALWTFVEIEGIEPTNNAAERALRRGVIWRRRSFGTQSEAGSRFVERILTVVMTLRQQKRNVLDYLTAACKAHSFALPTPSLLPAASVSPIHLCLTN
jgi:transposase